MSWAQDIKQKTKVFTQDIDSIWQYSTDNKCEVGKNLNFNTYVILQFTTITAFRLHWSFQFVASPTVIRPPPSAREAQQGETITIECEAIGVPTPIIVWRLNWGHVGKPPRVSYSQYRVIQLLLIQPTCIIRLFPQGILHWFPMLKATLNSTPLNSAEIFRICFGRINQRWLYCRCTKA